MKEFDIIGVSIFIPTIVCLLLAIQWGGTTYNWRNARIIVLFILAGLLFIAFVAVQIWQKDRATVPPSVMKQRTIWACATFSFFLFGSFLAFSYYIPIWFQAIKGDSATESGIHNLPSIIGTTVLSLISGGLVATLGYYTWACIISSILAAVVSPAQQATNPRYNILTIQTRRAPASSQPLHQQQTPPTGSGTK